MAEEEFIKCVHCDGKGVARYSCCTGKNANTIPTMLTPAECCVCGGTGLNKVAELRAISREVYDSQNRVVLIKDVRDIPYADAKKEIIGYIESIHKDCDIYASDIIGALTLDIDVVFKVLKELGHINEDDSRGKGMQSPKSPDMLAEIFEYQGKIDGRVQDMPPFSDIDQRERVHRLIQFAVGELNEADSKVGYVCGVKKHWQTKIKPAFLEEMVDVFHFFVSALRNADFTAEDLYDGYMKKNLVNHERQDEGY